jgi:hypothetical protein
VIGYRGGRHGREFSGHGVPHLDDRRTVRLGACADRLMPGRVDVVEVAVIDEFQRALLALDTEEETAPGHDRGLVRDVGKLEILFAVKLAFSHARFPQ